MKLSMLLIPEILGASVTCLYIQSLHSSLCNGISKILELRLSSLSKILPSDLSEQNSVFTNRTYRMFLNVIERMLLVICAFCPHKSLGIFYRNEP